MARSICNVPECNEFIVGAGLCNKHYHDYKNIRENYENIAEYARVYTKPYKSCNHERVGDNLILYKNGRGVTGFRCKQCKRKKDAEYYQKTKKLKKETKNT